MKKATLLNDLVSALHLDVNNTYESKTNFLTFVIDGIRYFLVSAMVIENNDLMLRISVATPSNNVPLTKRWVKAKDMDKYELKDLLDTIHRLSL